MLIQIKLKVCIDINNLEQIYVVWKKKCSNFIIRLKLHRLDAMSLTKQNQAEEETRKKIMHQK